MGEKKSACSSVVGEKREKKRPASRPPQFRVLPQTRQWAVEGKVALAYPSDVVVRELTWLASSPVHRLDCDGREQSANNHQRVRCTYRIK